MRGQVPHGGIGVGTLSGFPRLKPYLPQCKQQQQHKPKELPLVLVHLIASVCIPSYVSGLEL